MVLFRKTMLVANSPSEVQKDLAACAYRFSKPSFSGHDFSMRCIKRHNGYHRFNAAVHRVTGTLLPQNSKTKLTISIHADFSFWFGCAVILLGVAFLMQSFFSHNTFWFPCLLPILFGLFIIGISLWSAKELLEQIVRKLHSSRIT